MHFLAFLLAAQASADASAWKLAVQWGDGMAITGYPSQPRCEEAARAIDAERVRRIADARRNNPPGAIITSYNVPQAFCIPG